MRPRVAVLLLAVPFSLAAAESTGQIPIPSPSQGKDAPGRTDSVALGFCWAPGMKADVTASTRRTQTNGRARGGTIRYTLEVSEQGEHLRVRLVDPVADLSGAKQPVTPEAQARIDERLDDLLPDYLVTRQGKFAGLTDLPEYQARLRAMIEKSLPAKVDRAAIQKGLDRATSEPVLNARVSQEWNVLVQAWAGSTLPVGVEQTRQVTLGAPGTKGVVVTHTYSATARVPCRRGGEDRACVQLDLRSVPDSEAVKAQIGAALAAMGRTATTEVRSMSIDEHVRLVTEAECLVPHSFTRTRTQKMTMLNKGKEESVERTDRSVVSYTFR
jgi:hypothetical protein